MLFVYVCVCVCVSACKSQSQEAQDFLDELKLAVAWNRVDIAKSDIFNGDVEWKVRQLHSHLIRGLSHSGNETCLTFSVVKAVQFNLQPSQSSAYLTNEMRKKTLGYT